MFGLNVPKHQRDDRLGEALKRLTPAMPPEGEWPRVLAKVTLDAKRAAVAVSAAPTEAEKNPPSEGWLATGKRRPRGALAYAAISLAALIFIAGVGTGIFEAVTHPGKGTPVVVITDDTTGVSPGSTGQTAQSTDEQPSAAMFRGNAARTGVYPSGGPTDQPDLLWEFKTGDYEGTSPVVSDGVIYVGGEDDSGGYLYALDARSGEERWRFPWSDNWRAWNPSCPAVSEGVVYVRGADGYFYALGAGSGQELWRFPTGAYNVSSPSVSDGLVYFAADAIGYLGTDGGYLYALDAESGQERWRFPTGSSKVSFPAVSDGLVYIGTYGGYLYALDAQTGEERWTAEPDGPSRTTGSEPWSFPVVSGGVVYFGESGALGYLYALDAQTGEEKWTYWPGGTIRSSPAVSDGMVYLLYDGGKWCHTVALDATTGKELWQFATANNSTWWDNWSSPSVSGNVVCFGTQDESGSGLHALDALTGEELWTWVTSGDSGIADSSPAISDGVIYFSAADGYLYALK